MPVKERKSSSHSALFATPWVLTALDQSSAVSSEESHPSLKDSTTRKYSPPSDRFYSGALKGKGAWNEKTLDKYLKSPADYAPGNSMAFAGIPNAKDRADLIAYLKNQK